jgi:hypothetical protein
MARHENPQSGQPAPRRRRRRLAIALGSAVLMVSGLLQPLGLVGSAHADDHITGPLTDAINRNAKNVQDSLAAAQAAVAALTANAQTFAGTVTTIVQGAPSDPAGALTALQGAATAELGSLAGVGLTQALTLASRVSTPTCSTLGALTAILPDTGKLNPAIFGPLAPTLAQLDAGISNALQTFYTNTFTKLLTPITLPGGAAALAPYLTLAQTLLSLLKMNWHTTYYPPGGGTPVVRDTPGFLGLPTFLDVDGHTGEDVCALFNVNINTSAIAQSTLSQQIARLPFTGTLPLDVQGQFLSNAINVGYETKTSKAPASYITSSTATDTTVDTTLFKAGTTFDQVSSLLGLASYRLSSTNAPTSYHFASSTPGGTSGNGTQYNYSALGRSGHFAYTTALGGTPVGGIAQTPGATSLEYCTSAKGFCSNESAAASATEGGSMHLLASEPVQVDQTGLNPASTTCPALALLPEAHLTGQRMYLGFDPTAKSDTPGHVWVDTANSAATGCLATIGLKGSLPAGFKSSARNATWQGTGNTPLVTAKSGTITCPDGTTVSKGALPLSSYFCVFKPVNTVAPSITGNAYQGVTLTGVDGTWTPGAPNTPTLARQWQRCAFGAASCFEIYGATTTTYKVTPADLNTQLRYTVNGSNPDGSTPGVSPLTNKVTPPPAPVNIALPIIAGLHGSGKQLTENDGTWDNGVDSYDRQWFRCPEVEPVDLTGCAPISGATGTSYTTGNADIDHQLKVRVTAHNLNPVAGVALSAGWFIPPAPQNTTLPQVYSGVTAATGQTVFEGDRLNTALDLNDWKYADAAGFSYQWQRCDSSGQHCNPIGGATAATYTVGHGDIGSTLNVVITASNLDGQDTQTTPVTGVVLANALLPVLPNLIPDGPVFAGTPSTNGTYIGGDFDTVGPRVGGGGAVPAAPTAPTPLTASLAGLVSGGTVNAVAPDTAGGYFLGGSFTGAVGLACKAIAHIKFDGTLDNSYCRSGLTGEVRALDYLKRSVKLPDGTSNVDILAVGGAFADGAVQNLMFLDPTGLPSAPGDQLDGAVNAIVDDSTVAATTTSAVNFFVGGAFTHLGTTSAPRLATVTLAQAQTANTPLALSASNNPGGVDCGGATCSNPEVKALAWNVATVLFPELIVGGTFDTVYLPGSTTGVARSNAAAFALGTVPNINPVIGGWNPGPNGPVTAISYPLLTNQVYLAGSFTALTNPATTGLKGLVEYGIATTTVSGVRTNKDNGAGTAVTSSPNTQWKPQVDNGQVLSILVADSGVYLGGSFTSIGGTVRHRLAHITAASATAPSVNNWDPNAGQTVRSLARFAPSPGTPSIYVGGDYQVLGGTTRNHIAELKQDGTFTTWAPSGTDGAVRALATAGGVLYAGGDFANSGATARKSLAAFDTSTAALTTWNPGTDGKVHALQVAGSTIYVGGAFGQVGTSTRNNLAAVDNTGAVTSWNPNVTGTIVRAIAVDSSTVYIGGEFTKVGTTSHTNLAAIATGSGTDTGWNPQGTNGPVYALALDSTTVFVGGKFTSAAGSPCLNGAGIDRGTGTFTGWDPQANDLVRSLALLGTKVFAGGDFTMIGGAARAYAAQLSTDDGTADLFNPDPNARVYAITTLPSGLVGLFGSFSTLAGGAVATNGYAFYGG